MGYLNDKLKDVKTVGELMEILKHYPENMEVVYDYGLLLTVSEFEMYLDGTIVLNFS